MTVDDWQPRTPREALIKIDAYLADIEPRITDARARLAEALPGFAGRPSGNGEPGGGRGLARTTVVERTAFKPIPELDDLADIDPTTGQPWKL